MIRMKRHLYLGMGCILMCLLFVVAGQSMAQCDMTSAALDAAVQSCEAGDIDCHIFLAGKNPSCAGNIAWYYMLLNNPDNPQAVLGRFLGAVPGEYANELTASVNEAYRINQEEQRAGSSTSGNEYPFGQGDPGEPPYGQ